MELFEAMQTRASYRGEYLMDRVPAEDMETIVRAGMAAPSGRNMQTTSFVIVDDESLLSEIGKILPSRLVASAPAIIAAAFREEDGEDIFASEREDCAAAVLNMLLAITALGYASCWIDGELKLEGRAEKLSALLRLPAGVQVRVLLPVGKPAAEIKRPRKLAFAQRTRKNQWK
jgi:nitroreductase